MKDHRISIALQAAILVSLMLAAMVSAPTRDRERAGPGPVAESATAGTR